MERVGKLRGIRRIKGVIKMENRKDGQDERSRVKKKIR